MNTTATKTALPTKSNPDWKYTNLSLTNFELFQPIQSFTASNALETPINSDWLVDPKASLQWIFYNGHLIQKPKENLWDSTNKTFRIPKNYVSESPLYLIQILETNEKPLMYHPTTVIEVEENAKATLIELYLCMGQNPSYLNANTQLKLAKNTNIHHVFMQHANHPKGLQMANLAVHQAINSQYTANTLQIGGEINRLDYKINLAGQAAACQLNMLELANSNQQMELLLSIYHEAPNTISQSISRAIVKDTAKCAFTGKIFVPKVAHKTKASLENKNLVLSPYAEANAQPQLYIDTNDIECSHGATVGSLDPDALFYLRSRGLPQNAAENFLIQSFMQPALQGLPINMKKYMDAFFYAG